MVGGLVAAALAAAGPDGGDHQHDHRAHEEGYGQEDQEEAFEAELVGLDHQALGAEGRLGLHFVGAGLIGLEGPHRDGDPVVDAQDAGIAVVEAQTVAPAGRAHDGLTFEGQQARVADGVGGGSAVGAGAGLAALDPAHPGLDELVGLVADAVGAGLLDDDRAPPGHVERRRLVRGVRSDELCAAPDAQAAGRDEQDGAQHPPQLGDLAGRLDGGGRPRGRRRHRCGQRGSFSWRLTSAMSSISTAMPKGNSARPTALRV